MVLDNTNANILHKSTISLVTATDVHNLKDDLELVSCISVSNLIIFTIKMLNESFLEG